MIAGTFVNGPYALITTAVSAELGNKVANSHALATVTAIIDGTGSIGIRINLKYTLQNVKINKLMLKELPSDHSLLEWFQSMAGVTFSIW